MPAEVTVTGIERHSQVEPIRNAQPLTRAFWANIEQSADFRAGAVEAFSTSKGDNIFETLLLAIARNVSGKTNDMDLVTELRETIERELGE